MSLDGAEFLRVDWFLQVGKLLSELLRDGGGQAGRQASAGGIGGEQGRWQAELSRVALELIAVSFFLGHC